MRKIFIFLFLVGFCHCQSLPDSVSVTILPIRPIYCSQQIKEGGLLFSGEQIARMYGTTCESGDMPAETAPKPQPDYSEHFDNKSLLALGGATVFAILADRYDVKWTERGLKAGVAIEGNTWLVGTHPSAGALYKRDALVIGLVCTPSLVGYLTKNKYLTYVMLALPVAVGIGHIQGGNSWRNLLHQ